MIKVASARFVFRNCIETLARNSGSTPIPSSRIKINLQIRSIQTTSSAGRMEGGTKLMNQSLANPAASNPKHTRFADILKSEEDKREYRGLVLDNGMRVILISDPQTDKSAAALSVEVGYLSDPEEVPGLAHFLEHMLFLGTAKYPEENSYSTFLASNGGTSNASTYADTTKYYFEVVPNKLAEALDIFAQFFISPLFTESATEREINAVDSEHEKNLNVDAWRVRQVNKELCDNNHPFRKFGTGSKKTLSEIPKTKGIDVRQELINFHNKWYSANLMCIAVLGKESLDELEQMVLNNFTEIQSKNIEKQVWDSKPYSPEKLGTLTSIVPVKDVRSLNISFQMEDLEKHYKTSPEHYLSHLIGHESEGSILSELKRRGLCNNLMGGYSSSGRGFGFFDISVDLTTEGFKNYDEVVKIIFQYINLLKKEGPQRWIFDECSQIGKMQFRFKDKENPLSLVSGLVHAMQVYPLNEVLSAPYLVYEWKPELIDYVLNHLFPENARFILLGQDNKSIATETEPVYGTQYVSRKIPNTKMVEWTNCGLNENLALPKENPFIPTNFELKKYEAAGEHPTIVCDDELIRVWFKQDNEFGKPKACINIDLSCPIAYHDPGNANMTHLFVQMMKDQLNEFLYDAELAGLKFSVANTTYGISIAISGYQEKQSVLLQKVCDCLFDFKIDKKRFDIIKDQYIRGLKNFKAEQPYSHTIYYLALLLSEVAWTKSELLDSVNLLTVEQLGNFIEEFKHKLHAECFIYGNYTREDALEISTIVSAHLRKSTILPLNSRQLLLKREIKLDDGDSYLFQTDHRQHKSNCTSLYLQMGVQNDINNAFTDLVVQIINEPCYNTLRTQEQLGYIVFCSARRNCGAQGIRFIVQSNRHPAYVEERIESFLRNQREVIATMSEEQFEKHKLSLAALKMEKPKRLGAQFSRYLNEISMQQYNFDRQNTETAVLRKITKEELLKFYDEFLMPDAEKRRALTIYIISSECNEKFEKLNNNKDEKGEEGGKKQQQEITDFAQFKSSKELFSNTQPYINIQPKGAKSKL